jgi:hypothetical protein
MPFKWKRLRGNKSKLKRKEKKKKIKIKGNERDRRHGPCKTGWFCESSIIHNYMRI